MLYLHDIIIAVVVKPLEGHFVACFGGNLAVNSNIVDIAVYIRQANVFDRRVTKIKHEVSSFW